MAQVNPMEAPLGRGRRIALIIVGALIVFLAAGPPDFGAGYVVSGWQSDLDGGAHKLHIIMRGVSTLLVAVAGLVLIVKPSWALGVAQKFIAKGAAFLVAAVLGQFFWPPVVVYPIFAIVVAAVVLWAHRGRLPWQQPRETRPSISMPMLAAALVVAIPLIIWGLNEASLQRSSETLHGDLGHWAGGTAAAFTIVFAMLFAARRMPGWRVPAWTAGATLFMLGLASAIMPNQASSVGVGWGVLAIVAAAGFVALAEYEKRAEPVPATTHPVQPARS
jgi:MFS family permease